MEKLKSPKNRRKIRIPVNFYEKKAWESEHIIVGIDEVGRGCLAGPVVAAAVVLPAHTRYYRLKDSKKLAAQERALAHKWIRKNCVFGVGIAHNRLIDKYNIYNATIIAMKRALSHLIAQIGKQPDVIVIDAIFERFTDMVTQNTQIYSFNKGEDYSKSIAAASILAKEVRDMIMSNHASITPQYGLESHVGYGTKQHLDALDVYGPSLIHRNSFLQKYMQKKEADAQQSFVQ